MITDARDATALAPSAIVTPASASSLRRAGSVSVPTTTQPRSTRLRAMAPPMMPSPMIPTVRSVTLRRLLLVARQEGLERPLDRARTGTDYGLATIGPGLGALEPGAAPHETAAVFRLIFPAAA